jgi:hypothetical protein
MRSQIGASYAERRASTAEELVEKLKAIDCKLSVAGDRLALSTGGDQIPPLLLMELLQHKSAIIDLLKQPSAPPASRIVPLSAPPVFGANGQN